MIKNIDGTLEKIICSRCEGNTVFIRIDVKTGKVSEVNCVNYLPRDNSFRCVNHSDGQCI